MSRPQKYISILLERLPKYELRSYEHQTSLDRLRDRISSAPDMNEELKNLYKVNGFSDFALSLMWIADKVAKDPSLEESTLEEETLVFTKFRQAIGDLPQTAQEQPAVEPSTPMFNLSTSSGFETTSTPEVPPSFDSVWGTASQPEVEQTNIAISNNAQGNEQERGFASLLERFLESVQSGNDDRSSLMSEVISECNKVLNSIQYPKEYRNFCQLLVEFLQYITNNQFLDDIRVMNIVSNIQDPFAQWVRSEPENRAGMLEQAIDILRDFRAMFE